jgi:uncharacterized protein
MIVNIPDVSRSLSKITFRRPQEAPRVGTLRRFVSPRVLELSVSPAAPQLLGRLVDLHGPSGASIAKVRVVSDRTTERARFARGVIQEAKSELLSLPDHQSEQYAVSVNEEAEVEESRAAPLGFVASGSHIGAVHFDLDPDVMLSEGELAWVTLSDGSPAYYQIVGATVRREDSSEEGSVQAIHVEGSQLGVWNPTRSRFEPINWVAPPGAVVFRFSEAQQPEAVVPGSSCQVGIVPNSDFPVHIDIDDAVTENCAVIGVTGSGKSYLAFHYIESMVRFGLKVLILDLSRQHWVFLRHLGPTALRQPEEVDAWLASDSPVGIHQFAADQSYPLTTQQFVERVFRYISTVVRLKAGKNEPARICVVLEEAHSLVPEWNQVTDQRDKDRVNATARLILQGRKFGLGCLVITQRTANVTKTILNQCNTIFALQSFDQTGLDFLRNYMGDAYARAMASLPVRHAILVGKASSSTRPILFAISDFEGRWGEDASDINVESEQAAD